MKQFSTFCLVLAIFFPVLLSAQYPFQKDLGNIGVFETGSSLTPLPTGNFLLTGDRQASSTIQVVLTEIDPNGNVIWERAYNGGTTYNCHGLDVIPEPQGAVCIAGRGYPNAPGPVDDAILIQTTLNGSMQWAGGYGTANGDEAFNAVTQAWIYGYVATGYGDGNNSTANSKDVLVVLASNNTGSMYWGNSFGGIGDDEGLDIIEDAPGKYVIAGRSESYNPTGNSDIYVLCLDSNGTQLWSLVVDGGGDETAHAIIKDGNGYALTGSTNSFSPTGVTRPFLLKLDSAGTLVSFQTYDTPTNEVVGYDLQKTANGYAIGGSVLYQYSFMLFLDGGGTATQMVQYAFGDDIKKFVPLSNATDGGYMGVGTRGLFTAVGPDIFVIRTDSSGGTVNSCADTLYTPTTTLQTPASSDPQETVIPLVNGAAGNILADTFSLDQLVRCGICSTVPMAAFSVSIDTVMQGDSVCFTNNSTGATSWCWAFGDGDSATVQDPCHVFADTGVYTVTLTAKKDPCPEDDASVTIVVIPGMNGLETSPELLTDWEVFPNPFQEEVSVQFGLRQSGTVNMRILNALGQPTGYISTQQLLAGTHQWKVPTAGLAPGLYLVQMEINGAVFTRRVTKQ